MTVATVYVGERATVDQVRAAVTTWQDATPGVQRAQFFYDPDGDGYPGMGVAVDVYGKRADDLAERLAEGIRPFLEGIPVAVERELRSPTAR